MFLFFALLCLCCYSITVVTVATSSALSAQPSRRLFPSLDMKLQCVSVTRAVTSLMGNHPPLVVQVRGE